MMDRNKRMATIATLIILLALIRTIAEPLRLQYYAATSLLFEQVKPFLIAGVITATCLLFIAILYYYEYYKTIIAIAVFDIAIMVIIKILML